MDKRVLFAAAGWPLLFQPALADTRDDVWAAMQRCQVIQDDRTWLDCMYGAKQPMRAKLGLRPAPEYQQRLVPPASAPALASNFPRQPLPPVPQQAPRQAMAPAAPQHNAGVLQILGGTAAPVTVSTLARLQYDNTGAFVVTLENGQVWRQTDAEMNARPRLKIGTRVTVTPGALWSYKLKTSDNPRTYRVERKT